VRPSVPWVTSGNEVRQGATGGKPETGFSDRNTDPLPSKPTALCEYAERFLAWVADGRLEEKTKKFYRNGWRLLKATPVAGLRVNQITEDFAEH
jgi:hypothetical protein